ncbi:Holliday junction DNA helicase RuvA [[Clostridium] cellulosi]|jgi:Holliday junction DNA helicase subunit RuvA|uniref:Holliday junction branch migration complex subunit RuvA n=1 Tax=[Clostridium] cellulosi TaxID=29343 RepID=A0A078KTQ3_9FIRM|nr:MAG: Holliday junction branch migration protein RuvA [[Clostridium] cellulosi]CDZ24560.1 Holliday junction DNA helicase RuvA [[Clostridium] cellulosi]
MIYSVSGVLTYVEPTFAVIECGGVGFKCLTTSNTLKKLPSIGEKVKLYTYLNVREDALDLYGFFDDKELQCFKMLISVSGVGPKNALSVLSEMTPEKFALYVASGDSRAIQKAQGIGAKTAQRIVLELKDKVSGEQAALGFTETEIPASASGNIEEAISALMVLGYSRSEAASAASKSDASLPVEEIIKQSLRLLAK